MTEEYVVKFWITSDTTGWWEQRSESIFFSNKNSHKKAEAAILKKYGKGIRIVSVTYQ